MKAFNLLFHWIIIIYFSIELLSFFTLARFKKVCFSMSHRDARYRFQEISRELLRKIQTFLSFGNILATTYNLSRILFTGKKCILFWRCSLPIHSFVCPSICLPACLPVCQFQLASGEVSLTILTYTIVGEYRRVIINYPGPKNKQCHTQTV